MTRLFTTTALAALSLSLIAMPAYAQDFEAQDAATIQVGQRTNGQITQTDIKLEDQSFADLYRFRMERGQRYSVTMRSDDFDTYLVVLDDEFDDIGRNDDAEGLGLNSQVVFTADYSGLAYVVANTLLQAETGAYSLTVEAIGDEGGNPIRRIDDDEPDNARVYRDCRYRGGEIFTSPFFEAQEGQTYTLETTNLAAGTDTVLMLMRSTHRERPDEDDPVIAENDDHNGTLASRIEWRCPEDGVYYAAVRGFGEGDGRFDLRIAEGSLALRGGYTNIEVTADEPFYSDDFRLIEGRNYRISTYDLSVGCDTVIELRESSDAEFADDNDRVMVRDDDGGEGLASSALWTCTRTGDYYVAVSAFGNSGGTCSLSIEEVDENGLPLGVRVIDTIDVQLNANREYRYFGDFGLDAGEVVVIETTDLSPGTDTVIELRRSTDPDEVDDNDPVVARDDDGGEGLASRIVWTVDRDGAYYVAIRAFGDAGGECTLLIHAE